MEVVAVLHDILEDTECPESEVAKFGSEVLDAVKLSIEEILLKRDIRWNRLDLATYTPDIGEVDLMAWLVKAFEPVFQRKEDTKTKSAALSVGTKFTKFEYEGTTSGVRWVRSSGDHSLFSLTVYDKKSAVKKREAMSHTFTNMGEHEKKVAVNNAKLIDRVGNRLRIEVQVYPEAFFRGKASKTEKTRRSFTKQSVLGSGLGATSSTIKSVLNTTQNTHGPELRSTVPTWVLV